MTTAIGTVWPLAALTTLFNYPLGRLRAGAGRRSPRRFGLLAASVLLLFALRHAFGLDWPSGMMLVAGMALGQTWGRRSAASEPSPLRWRLAAYAAIVAGLVLLLAQPVQAQGDEWHRLDTVEPAPAFTLTNQEGQRVALDDFRGKVVLLSFIYTECKDICPVLPQIIGRVDKELTAGEREKTRFAGISLDPRRDTPAKLKTFMQTHSLSPERWTLLTGTLEEATKAAKDYGIVVRPDIRGEFIHNAVYILIDPQGQLRTEFHGLFTPTEEIAKALRGLIGEEGAASAGKQEK
ncbi:MAG: hypothetical protein A2286_08785 [Gammaproteobacteria bacterium RIFOXYA12_FULL_61_12]|nr:MAG: hypothetical protein A2286_08785 [Gammaproteobacteria bacterium RIFOXYA12_FULL_61_12]OGT91849.1 MAG: hypothetical protein A2514_06275 [Gammaproteobacteria bacterium RIFOXYD12_FULL_61_37]